MKPLHLRDEADAVKPGDPLRDPVHGPVTREERERLVYDLHDVLIQRLFAMGLMLKRTVGLVPHDPDGATARLEGIIDDLDETVRHIRATDVNSADRPCRDRRRLTP